MISVLYAFLVYFRAQNLAKSFIDAGSFYFFNVDKIKKYNSIKNAKKIMYHKLDYFENVDVDTPKDWEILKFKFKHKK